MATMRNWCAALFVVPTALLASHAASAAPTPAAAQAPAQAAVQVLPEGIHLRADGRYTRDNCDHSQSHYCLSKTLLPRGWMPGQPIPPRVRQKGGGGGGLTPEGMGPSDIITAYKVPSNAAANGKIVAILDSPDSYAYSDLTEYRATYGLPTLPKCSGMPTGTSPCFAQVSESGGASSGQDSGQDSDGETSLDMEMISAVCPDCSILLVEIDNLTDNDFVTGCKTAASLGAVATSISIGGPEGAGPNDEGGMDPTGYTTAGHLVVAATGDFGYNLINESAQAQSPGYPASAPDVLAVGGTTLFNSGSSYDEAVWNDGNFSTGQNGQDVTTSGCSTEWAAPSWQMASLSGTGCGNRATADVSAAAAFYQQGQLIDIAEYQQGWSNAEGTSAAAPMVAGLLTRLGLAEIISNNLAWPYTNPTGWNDLGSTSYPVDSSGSNTDSNDPSSCGKLCTAGPGWDGPSGLGTPNGAVLAMLAGLPQPPPEVDAGMPGSGTGTSSSSETTGMGAGNESSPGSGQGASAPLPGALGAACAHASDCDSKLCAEPSPGELAVCTQACTSSPSSCLFGFACMDGYCFAAPGAGGGTGTTTGDAGAGGSNDAPSSSGGCAVSPTSEDGPSSWAGFACLGLGLALLSQRRRSERDRA